MHMCNFSNRITSFASMANKTLGWNMGDFELPKNVVESKNPFIRGLQNFTYKEFEEAVYGFQRQSAFRMKAGKWVENITPDKSYLEGKSAFQIKSENDSNKSFMPFVEKILVPQGSKILVTGDLHGNIEALVVVLDELRKRGLMDENFQFTSEEFYLVLLGDYVNRMPFSVEVVRLLFHLYSQNIGKVVLLRGNHEHAACNKKIYDAFAQFGPQHLLGLDTFVGEFARKFETYYFPDFLYWYEYLPLTCYIGCKDDSSNIANFMQFCHAGIELGFVPDKLMADEKSRFQKITHLNRYEAIEQLAANPEMKDCAKKIRSILDYFKKNTAKDTLKEFVNTFVKPGNVDLSIPHSPLAIRTGIQWNGFLTENNDYIQFSASIKKGYLYTGEKLTRHFLEKSSTDNAKIFGIVRAHQHLNDCDENIGLNCSMLDQIKKAKSLLTQWNGLVRTYKNYCASASFLDSAFTF